MEEEKVAARGSEVFTEIVALEFSGVGDIAKLKKKIQYIHRLTLVGCYTQNLSSFGVPFKIALTPNITTAACSSCGTNKEMDGTILLPGTAVYDLDWPLAYFEDGLFDLDELTLTQVDRGVTFDRLVLILKVHKTK